MKHKGEIMMFQKNLAQEEAVQTHNGPVLLVSCPGSGKTTTMLRRINSMITSGIQASSIVMVTFTDAAAQEMKARYIKEYGECCVAFCTIHSMCLRILKEYSDVPVNVIPAEIQYGLLRQCFRKIRVPYRNAEMLKGAFTDISACANSGYEPSMFHPASVDKNIFPALFAAYQEAKREAGYLDFDDMLCVCRDLLRSNSTVLTTLQKRYPYLLCDEYQDTNLVQKDILYMLAGDTANLCVVGDDDQSIYGFRGAKPELMLYMKQEFPSLRTISLTVNYRSTEFITGAAARVILHNDTRFYKRVQSFRGRGQNVHVQEVLDEQEEAQYVTEEIQKKLDQGIKPGEIAVLFRAAVQARMISEILSEHRIPFEMRDYVTNFYRHFIVKDMMAYLQLAAGKRDRSLFLTICNRPLRYLARNSMENRQVNFEDLRKFYCDKDWMLDIIDQFDVDVRMMKNMAPYAAIQYIRKKIGYDDFLKEYAEKHQISWKQLMDVMAELEERSKNFKSYDEWEIHIAKYTQELEEQQAKARKIKGERENKVQLMTIHSAKGLEFEDVFVIHANEGEIPHQKAEKKDEIEEERRLFYVALTRAKNNLCISYITQKNGNSIKPSRFVEELLGQRIK